MGIYKKKFMLNKTSLIWTKTKQAPRVWYERLSKFLLNNNFQRGKVDNTLFIKQRHNDILLVQIYVDDIIFGATNENLCKEFATSMQGEFEMSMMENLLFPWISN